MGKGTPNTTQPLRENCMLLLATLSVNLHPEMMSPLFWVLYIAGLTCSGRWFSILVWTLNMAASGGGWLLVLVPCLPMSLLLCLQVRGLADSWSLSLFGVGTRRVCCGDCFYSPRWSRHVTPHFFNCLASLPFLDQDYFNVYPSFLLDLSCSVLLPRSLLFCVSWAQQTMASNSLVLVFSLKMRSDEPKVSGSILEQRAALTGIIIYLSSWM